MNTVLHMVINIQPYLIDTNGYTGRLTAELTSGTSDLLASSHFGQPNNNVSIKHHSLSHQQPSAGAFSNLRHPSIHFSDDVKSMASNCRYNTCLVVRRFIH